MAVARGGGRWSAVVVTVAAVVCHSNLPPPRCRPLLFMRKDNKSGQERLASFPSGNGDFRAFNADYILTNMAASFFL